MNKLMTMALFSLMVGCGSSGGSGASFNAATAPNTNTVPGSGSATALKFSLKRMGVDQVVPYTNVLRCEVENIDSRPHEFGGFVGSFISTNPSQVLVNYDLQINGNRELKVGAADSTRPLIMSVSKMVQPGEKLDIYLLANPHTLHVRERFGFAVTDVIVDGMAVAEPIQPPLVLVNPAGIKTALMSVVPLFIPHSQSANNVVVWTERLLPTTTIEQTLYDYEFRFRSGDRNLAPKLDMRGTARMEVSEPGTNVWRIVDQLFIHGDYNTHHYKFAFFGEDLGAGRDVRIVLDLANCLPGDQFLVDRTTVGSSTGFINFPTWHGPVFTCN